MDGSVVHFEVPFSDGERAKNFYRQAFGWQLNDIPEMKYTIVSTGPPPRRVCPPNPDSSVAACSNADPPLPRGR